MWVPAKKPILRWKPLCGSVNLPDYNLAVQVNRLTTKQFRRTLNSSCIEVRIPRRWEAHKFLGSIGRPGQLAIDFPAIARGCWTADYPTCEEAFARIDSGSWFSVAISRRVIVAGDDSGKRIFYYDGEPAASAIGGHLYPMGDESAVARIIKATGGTYHATPCY
jgi:hypothetical protein